MDKKEYLVLLDKAYSELPKVLYTKGRFEIPKVSGKLVKTRTIISNFQTISKDLSRQKEHLMKYFLKEAGVRGDLNPRGELILHSRFQPAILNKIIEVYFKNYVECPYCRSPDTNLNNLGTEITCKACGHTQKVKGL